MCSKKYLIVFSVLMSLPFIMSGCHLTPQSVSLPPHPIHFIGDDPNSYPKKGWEKWLLAGEADASVEKYDQAAKDFQQALLVASVEKPNEEWEPLVISNARSQFLIDSHQFKEADKLLGQTLGTILLNTHADENEVFIGIHTEMLLAELRYLYNPGGMNLNILYPVLLSNIKQKMHDDYYKKLLSNEATILAADILSEHKLYQRSLPQYQKALLFCNTNHYLASITYIKVMLALNESMLKNYKLSESYLQSAEEDYNKYHWSKETSTYPLIITAFGLIALQEKQNDKAIMYALQAQHLIKKLFAPNSAAETQSMSFLISAYLNNHQFDKALFYYPQVIRNMIRLRGRQDPQTQHYISDYCTILNKQVKMSVSQDLYCENR